MSEPWFDANSWSWLPGTAFGVLGGLWGSLAGILGSKGKGTGVIWAGYWFLLLAGAVSLVVGIYAVATGQPYGIWYAFLLPGVIALAVVAPLGIVVRNRQRMNEQRRMQAAEFE